MFICLVTTLCFAVQNCSLFPCPVWRLHVLYFLCNRQPFHLAVVKNVDWESPCWRPNSSTNLYSLRRWGTFSDHSFICKRAHYIERSFLFFNVCFFHPEEGVSHFLRHLLRKYIDIYFLSKCLTWKPYWFKSFLQQALSKWLFLNSSSFFESHYSRACIQGCW